MHPVTYQTTGGEEDLGRCAIKDFIRGLRYYRLSHCKRTPHLRTFASYMFEISGDVFHSMFTTQVYLGLLTPSAY